MSVRGIRGLRSREGDSGGVRFFRIYLCFSTRERIGCFSGYGSTWDTYGVRGGGRFGGGPWGLHDDFGKKRLGGQAGLKFDDN